MLLEQAQWELRIFLLLLLNLKSAPTGVRAFVLSKVLKGAGGFSSSPGL